MIPQEKTAAVTRALREAFGVTGFEDIRRMTKGHGYAMVFRIVVRGAAYLLRVVVRPNAMLGPGREHACMRAAAQAGLAPRVRYASMEDEITVMDFVEEKPFPAREALVRMPAALRALHALPPFPKGVDHFDTSCMFLLHQGAATEGFIEKFHSANILTKDESEELRTWHAQLAAVYPRNDSDMVSSHNDLFKPDNILYDGDRVWLIDWEAAFLNDRYADLAVVANLLVTNREDEGVFLREYFGRPPDEYQLARFFLMRQVAHMFYAMAYLLLGSSGKPPAQSKSVPEFSAFQRSMWAGEINLADEVTKVVYGSVHWEKLVRNMRGPRFGEALRILSTK